MKIDYVTQEPERDHVLRLGLRFQTNIDNVEQDEIYEVPVRKSHFESLKSGARLTYVHQAYRWHHLRDRLVRESWDAEDKAAERERFEVRCLKITDERAFVEIKHHGLVFTGEVERGSSPAEFETNCRNAFAEYESQMLAQDALLNSYTISK